MLCKIVLLAVLFPVRAQKKEASQSEASLL